MKKQLIILLSFFMMLLSFAEEGNQKTAYKVENIIVKNLREVPESRILMNMSTKKGDVFSTEKVLGDYKKLKALEYIQGVIINPEYSDTGVNLLVSILEKPDAINILRKKGIVPSSDVESIDKSVRIEEISVYGNSRISTKEILSMIPLKAGGYYSQNKLAEGYKNVGETGYFRQVVPDVVKIGNDIRIDFYVTENPVVSKVNIIGNTVYTTEELLALLKTKENQILNYNNLREDREMILNKYNIDGYTLAKIIDIGVTNSYELDIILSEGMVRDVQVQKMITKARGGRRQASDNLLKTRSYIIEREIELEKDSIFNERNYQETVGNLMRLGYIKNVKYETKDIPGDADGQDIILLIDEDRTARIQGTISYGSELGLLGMLSLEESNWKGKGQTLGMSYEKSDDDYTSFSINFSDPWIKDTNRISWGWSLYSNEYETSESQAFSQIDTKGFSINVGKGLSKYVRFGLGLKAENVETSPGEEYRSNPKYYDDEYWLYSVTPTLSYDTRNSYLNPTRGSLYKIGVEVGHAGGVGASDFVSTTGEIRYYHQGFTKNNTFAYRLTAGFQSEDTKESQRFWVGGSSSIRGFEGGTFKGTKKAVLNLENRTQFNDVLGLVFFVDAGRAWDYKGIDAIGNERDSEFPDEIAVGAGVGLRVNTPMGPLRFDFGWPVRKDDRVTDDGMQFYFNMGHSF